jgi:superfamily II DNA or RNA helicase
VGTFDVLLEQLDPDNDKIRGTQFEHLTKYMLLNDPVYEGQFRRVDLWDNWKGRWGSDKGIDLVAESHDGKLWAIQAKCYARDYRPTYTDMAKFTAESNRQFPWKGNLKRKFDFRLLVSSSDSLGPNATDVMKNQTIPVGFVLRSQLDEMIIWPDSLEDMRAPKPVPKRPEGKWAYQGEAMNKVVNGFQQADRGKLIMACGTGKTLVALFIREKLAAERTLVLMPSLQLMKQTIGEWKRNRKVDFDFLPVCSDETVSKDDDDMPVSSTSDLGFPVTTDPEEIATFLRRRSGPRVVFATYQSSPEIAKAFKLGRVPAFDLAIADEAHRCAAPHSSEFATILDKKNIKARRRLFMTATPRIYSARVLRSARDAGFEFASMDDEERFGKVFHRVAFREAIARKLLTDYQVAIIGVDNATYRDWAEKAWFITIDGKEVKDARAVAGQIGLAKAMRRYNLRRVITFHRIRKNAKEFSTSLPEVIDWMPTRQRPNGKLWTAYVDGTMSADDRQRMLRSLSEVGEGERGLISNARCLTEGIDVPTLDGVAFIDPKRSEIDIAQAVGRAIRLADGKTIGTIVIPVFIDTDEPNPDVILDDSAFKPVWDVLLALRSHDEELEQQLDDLRRMLGRLLRHNRRGSLRLPPRIKVDIPDVCGFEFARAFRVRLVEQTSASWDQYFGMLEQYVEENKDALVPEGYVIEIDGKRYALGVWINNQRRFYATGHGISDERIKRLEHAHESWAWCARDAKWEAGFACLKRFVEENHHANVPSAYVNIEGFKLGVWVGTQRGHWENLGEDRIQRLIDLGLARNARDAKWEEGFSHLSRYAQDNGHADVPQKYVTASGYPLGSWLATQRQVKGTMSEERRRRLRELGVKWNTGAEAVWQERYREYADFVQRNDRIPTQGDNRKLYAWGKWQRAHKDALTPDQLKLLDDIGFPWEDPRYTRIDKKFNLLRDYIEHNKKTPRIDCVVDGVKIGQFLSNQRAKYRRHELDDDDIELFEGLGEFIPGGWVWSPGTGSNSAKKCPPGCTCNRHRQSQAAV